MLFRVLAGVVPSIAGALFYTGALPIGALFSAGAYSQAVAASPDRVASALVDLNMDEVTMAGIGSSSHAIQLEHIRTAQGYDWMLKYDGKALVQMVATLTPEQDGTATRVNAVVKEGPDFVAHDGPLGLRNLTAVRTIFAAALDMELNEFAPEGQRLTHDQAEERRMAASTGAVATAVMSNPMAIAVEARHRQTEFETQMQDVEAEMRTASGAQANIRPGQPMLDPDKPLN